MKKLQIQSVNILQNTILLKPNFAKNTQNLG